MVVGVRLICASLLLLSSSFGVQAAAAGVTRVVADLFIACPYLGVTDQTNYQLCFDSAGPFGGDPAQRMTKGDILSGEPGTWGKGLKVVLDEANGYLSITGPNNVFSLVMVYYRHPDGSLIPAFRFSDNQGLFPMVSWGFYGIDAAGHWNRIADEKILPPAVAEAFLGTKPGAVDHDMLKLTTWDIELPRHGVNVLLTPHFYEVDSDKIDLKIQIPDSGRSVELGQYYQWADSHFCTGQKNKCLELLWVKAKSRFEIGRMLLKETNHG